MSIIIDLNMACLVCLQDDGGELKSIYLTPPAASLEADIETQFNIAEMIAQCSELMLHNVKAKLPDKICLRCLQDLMASWRFRQNCEAANSVYRSIQQQEEDAEALANYELERQKIKLPSGLKIRRIQPEIKTYLLQLDKEKTELSCDTSSIKDTNKTEPIEIIKVENIEEDVQVDIKEQNAIAQEEGEGEDEEEVEGETLSKEHEAEPCEQQIDVDDYLEEISYKEDDEVMEIHNDCTTSEHDKCQQQRLSSKSPNTAATIVQIDVERNEVNEKRGPKQRTTPRRHRERSSVKGSEKENSNNSSSRGRRFPKSSHNSKSEAPTDNPSAEKHLQTTVRSPSDDSAVTNSKSTPSRKIKSIYQPMKICEICGNTYKYQHALTAHMRRHTNDRQFGCELCDKAFVSNVELRRHMRVHTGHKPYACSFCDRRFSDFGSRSKHERTHTGERPYSCNSCNKTFAYAHVLTVHLRTHTGEKKFQCTHCGKGFTKKIYLLGHLEQHARCDRLAVNKGAMLDGDSVAMSIKSKPGATQQQQQQQEITAIKTVALEECIFTTEFIEDDEDTLTEDVDGATEDDASAQFIVHLDAVEENIDEEHLEEEFILGVR